jgi:hypothetical protein
MDLISQSMRDPNSFHSESLIRYSKSVASKLRKHSGTLRCHCHVCDYRGIFCLLIVSHRCRLVLPATLRDHPVLPSLPYGAYHDQSCSVMPCPEPQAQSETIRGAVENLHEAMKDYKILMKDSTAGRIGSVVKTGTALAEVFLLFPFFFNVLHPTARSESQAGIWPSKIRI